MKKSRNPDYEKRPESDRLRATVRPRYHLNFPGWGRFSFCNGKSRRPLLLCSGAGRESHLLRAGRGLSPSVPSLNVQTSDTPLSHCLARLLYANPERLSRHTDKLFAALS